MKREQTITCLAGQQGTVRLIGWAHTVELPEPWHWLSAGDLLMTTGLGLPVEAAEQVHWLEQLAQHKISALLFALAPAAPPLSKELLQAADRLRLPLLGADFSLAFARLSRLVIGSDSELSIARPLSEQRGLFGALIILAMPPPNPAHLANWHHHLALPAYRR